MPVSAADLPGVPAVPDKPGGSSVLEVWPGMVHVFQALPRLAPEAESALRRAAAFIAAAPADSRPNARTEAC